VRVKWEVEHFVTCLFNLRISNEVKLRQTSLIANKQKLPAREKANRFKFEELAALS
jgi:hypothetical protein